MNSNEDFIYEISMLKDLMNDTFRNSDIAYENLNIFKDDISYLMASNYLNMAHNSYLSFILFYQEHKLERSELDNWLKAYRHFKFQFDEVISKKDKNTSWLFSAHSQFEASHVEVIRFLDETMNAQMK